MTSPLLALFVRSLREDARGRATYWARGGLGVFLLIVLGATMAFNRWTGAPGRDFFVGIIILQLVAVTFVGLSYFASAVTEEKEDETLGLLRMTDLSPLSILLGKSTSRLCGALLLLAGQIPFTIFAITLGGTSFNQIVAVYCTMGAFTFLLCNLALLGSVVARRTAGAATFCLLALAVLIVAGPLVEWVHDWPILARFTEVQAALERVSHALRDATPMARLQEVLQPVGFVGAPAGWQVGTNLALGVACFLIAWALFERFCDRAPAGAAAGVRSRFLGWSWARPPRVWARALVWKDFYFLCGGRIGFALRALGYGGAVVTLLWQLRTWKMGGFPGAALTGLTQMLSMILSFVFSIDIAWMAARMFGTEWRDQTLATLVTLPDTLRQIAYRKALACLLAASPGLVAEAVVQIRSLTLFKSIPMASTGFSMQNMVVLQCLATVVTLVLLVHVVACLSLYMKRGALPVGYLLTHAGGMIVSMVFMTLMTATMFAGGVGRQNFNFIYLGQVISLIVSIVATMILHHHSLRRLETLAGEG